MAEARFTRLWTITYNSSGGTPTPASQTGYGNITLAAAPTKSGSTFAGWSINGTTYSAGATYNLTADRTAVAVWTAYVVKYDSRGGSACPDGQGVVTLPSTTRAGYTFNGWYNSSGGKVGDAGATYAPQANITLHAEWSQRRYQLGYDNDFCLVDWNENPLSKSMRSAAEQAGATVVTWMDGTQGGSITVRVPAAYGSSYLDAYTFYQFTTLAEAPVATFPVTPSRSYTMDGRVTFYSLSDNTPTQDPATNKVNSRIWIAFYDSAGNFLERTRADCGDSYGSSTFLLNLVLTTPADATQATLFFEAYLKGGERAVFSSIRVAETDRFNLVSARGQSMWLKSALHFLYNDAPNSTYNGCKTPNAATVPSPSRTGYVFKGWVDSVSGDLVSGESTVQPRNRVLHSTWEAIDYPVSVAADAPSAVAFSAFSATKAGEPAATANYGDSIVFSATLKDGYVFDGFYLDGTKITDGVTANGQVRSVTLQVSGETALVAKARAVVTLRVPSESHATFRVGGTAKQSHEWNVLLGETISYELDVDEGYYLNGWKVTGSESDYDYGYGGTGEYTPTASVDLTVDIEQGTPGATLYYTIGYEGGSDRTQGVVLLDGEPVEDESVVERAFDATGHVTYEAQPRNGYVFDGWYDDRSGEGRKMSASPSLTFLTTTGRTLFARFVQDTHYICEWEGSEVPKPMTWRSKTYAASKPFNPSACRVDALGYPPSNLLELTVDMFSAPNAEAQPTAHTTLTNIVSQDARRLPVRRMERYMQVEVKANVEVDTLLVGTSMEGIAL